MNDAKEAKSSDPAPGKTAHTSALRRPLDEIERLYEELLPRGWFHPPQLDWLPARKWAPLLSHRLPAVDIVDDGNEIIVRAEVPGVCKEDLGVTVSEHTLTIKGRTEHQEEDKREDYYRHELSYGGFARTLELPTAVDGAKVKANMKNGILEIRLPKAEPAKARDVEIEIH